MSGSVRLLAGLVTRLLIEWSLVRIQPGEPAKSATYPNNLKSTQSLVWALCGQINCRRDRTDRSHRLYFHACHVRIVRQQPLSRRGS